MNAYELADDLEKESKNPLLSKTVEEWYLEIATMLRQLQAERDLLFSAHSYEMVRADKLAIENDALKVALVDIIAISDRKHDAWDKAKELLK